MTWVFFKNLNQSSVDLIIFSNINRRKSFNKIRKRKKIASSIRIKKISEIKWFELESLELLSGWCKPIACVGNRAIDIKTAFNVLNSCSHLITNCMSITTCALLEDVKWQKVNSIECVCLPFSLIRIRTSHTVWHFLTSIIQNERMKKMSKRFLLSQSGPIILWYCHKKGENIAWMHSWNRVIHFSNYSTWLYLLYFF